jgi:hypothetical protein
MTNESGGNGILPVLSNTLPFFLLSRFNLSSLTSANAVNQNKDARGSLDVGLWQINDMVSASGVGL